VTAVRVERDGPITRVTLDRPEVRNAFDAGLIEELRTTFEGLSAEPPETLRAVVLSGAGPTFSAGADVGWMRNSVDLSIQENERDATRMQAMFLALDACPVPVLARIHGAALGGGMGLCAVADIVVATADATFGFTETKLGIVPAVISTFVVPKIGVSHARALFATGQRFGADRALAIGLVHEVVDTEADLDDRIEAILDELRAAGPTALREAKAIVRAVEHEGPIPSRDDMPARIARQRSSAEGQEGLRAFLERRPATWRLPPGAAD
jgi:methylglutaconyl-CoA hydratase